MHFYCDLAMLFNQDALIIEYYYFKNYQKRGNRGVVLIHCLVKIHLHSEKKYLKLRYLILYP